jgi:hypothetical protein
MGPVLTSLSLALGQLADGRVIWIMLKSLAVTLVLLVPVVLGGWHGLDWLLDWLGLDEGAFTGGGTVREIAALGGDVSWLVPPHIVAALKRAYQTS